MKIKPQKNYPPYYNNVMLFINAKSQISQYGQGGDMVGVWNYCYQINFIQLEFN